MLPWASIDKPYGRPPLQPNCLRKWRLTKRRLQVKYYQKAIELDQYLAIAYFQEGVSNFLLGDFEEAMANFNDTLLYLRGNRFIDYEQLGLKFRLYSCEVLFNRGLCYIYLHQAEPGMRDLVYASQEKLTADHGVIDEAIRENAEACPSTFARIVWYIVWLTRFI